jgi:hypothetical protein
MAGKIGHQQRAAGPQHPRHLGHGPRHVVDIDQHQIGDDEIGRAIRQRQPLGEPVAVVAAGIARHRRLAQRPRRLDADRDHAQLPQPAAEPPLAAADIDRRRKPAPLDPRQHRRIQHPPPRHVAMLAHVGDPGRRRFVPAIAHCPPIVEGPPPWTA